MKKILTAVFAFAVGATAATAGVGISWGTAFGVYDHTAADLVNGTEAILNTYSAIWQLIYAGPNLMIDRLDDPSNVVIPTTGGPNGDYVVGDDVVWAQRTVAQGGGSGNDAPYNTAWGVWLDKQSGDSTYENLAWSTAGFVYQRIFEGTPTVGSWYFETQLVAIDIAYAGGGAAPMVFNVDTPSTGVKPMRQFGLPIPEPATMGLLGLGAVVLATRRRRA